MVFINAKEKEHCYLVKVNAEIPQTNDLSIMRIHSCLRYENSAREAILNLPNEMMALR